MHKFRKKLLHKSQSIVTKIILIAISIILPINIQLIRTTKTSVDILKKQIVTANENTIKLYMNQLDSELESIDDYFYELASNHESFNLLMNESQGDDYAIAQVNVLQSYQNKLAFRSKMDAMFAVTENGEDVVLITDSGLSAAKQDITQFLSKLFEKEIKGSWQLQTIGKRDYLLRIYSYKGLKAGALILAETIYEDIHKLKEYENIPVVLSSEENVEAKKEELPVTVKSSDKPIYLSALLSEKDVLSKLPFMEILNYNISIGLLLLIPILLFVLKVILIRPLNKINRAINYIEDGNLDYRVELYKTSYEFDRINKALNKMIEQISVLKIDNYEKELQKQRIEYKNFQLQVKPHFLFNSFNLIFSMSQLKDFKGIQKMIDYLTQYFRYGLRGGSEMENIEDELNFVKEYLNIAEMRFPDCFKVNYEIEEDVLKQLIPSMMIHNFVENIIRHTLEIGEIIQITVAAYILDESVVINVKDNGKGIPEDILQCIQAGEMVKKDNENHIGIWNSMKRLKLFYGSEAKLLVESEINKGTKITITIPKGSDENYEAINNG